MNVFSSRLSSPGFGGFEVLIVAIALSVSIGLFLRGENTRVIVKQSDICKMTENPKLCRENLQVLGKQRDIKKILGPRVTIVKRPVRIIRQTVTLNRTVNVPVPGPSGPSGASGPRGPRGPIQRLRGIPSPPIVAPAPKPAPKSIPPLTPVPELPVQPAPAPVAPPVPTKPIPPGQNKPPKAPTTQKVPKKP